MGNARSLKWVLNDKSVNTHDVIYGGGGAIVGLLEIKLCMEWNKDSEVEHVKSTSAKPLTQSRDRALCHIF